MRNVNKDGLVMDSGQALCSSKRNKMMHKSIAKTSIWLSNLLRRILLQSRFHGVSIRLERLSKRSTKRSRNRRNS